MANLHSRRLYGNLIYFDRGTQFRWIDAIGDGVNKFLDHFIQTPFAGADSPAAYTTTLVETGASETTVALKDGADGGTLLITTDAADNDGANIQAKGEAFKFAGTNKQIYFGTRFKISEATQSDFLLGLCITDTDLLGGMTDGLYFRKVDGSTTLTFVLEKNSTETVSNFGTAVAADTWYTLEFLWDGTSVDWWVDGVAQTRPATTNLCDDEWLTPSIHVLTGQASSLTAEVDWIRAISVAAT